MGKHIVMIISVPIIQISKNYSIVPVKYLKKDKLTNADATIIPNYVTNTNIETIIYNILDVSIVTNCKAYTAPSL